MRNEKALDQKEEGFLTLQYIIGGDVSSAMLTYHSCLLDLFCTEWTKFSIFFFPLLNCIFHFFFIFLYAGKERCIEFCSTFLDIFRFHIIFNFKNKCVSR